MKIQIRTADILALHNGSHAAVARLFNPPLSRHASKAWGEFIPELRALQLINADDRVRELVVDETTGLTLAQMRARLASADPA